MAIYPARVLYMPSVLMFVMNRGPWWFTGGTCTLGTHIIIHIIFYLCLLLGRSGPVRLWSYPSPTSHSHSAENISAYLALVSSKKQRYKITPHWPHLFQFCSRFRLFLYLPVPPFFSFSILVLIVALDYPVESFWEGPLRQTVIKKK